MTRVLRTQCKVSLQADMINDVPYRWERGQLNSKVSRSICAADARPRRRVDRSHTDCAHIQRGYPIRGAVITRERHAASHGRRSRYLTQPRYGPTVLLNYWSGTCDCRGSTESLSERLEHSARHTHLRDGPGDPSGAGTLTRVGTGQNLRAGELNSSKVCCKCKLLVRSTSLPQVAEK